MTQKLIIILLVFLTSAQCALSAGEQPFAGDVINAYNDGSPGPGLDPLGPFYELETSSPALALKAGESTEHRQLTMHIIGSEKALSDLSQQELRTSIATFQTIFKP